MKRKGKSLSALMLACLVALLTFGGAAMAQEPAETPTAPEPEAGPACTLSLETGVPEITAELEESGVVYDLFKVTDAAPIPGVDAYTYPLTGAFAGLPEVTSEATTETWETMAQQAAEIVLADGSTLTPDFADCALREKVEDIPAGIYLVLAHTEGVSLAESKTTVKEKPAEGAAAETAAEKLATRAETPTHVYTFLPELIALPSKEGDEDGVISSSNPGDWQTDVRGMLKPQQGPRMGSLDIVKGLDGYVTGRPATFVFQVEAELDGENVYSNVFAVTFTGAGTQTVEVHDCIPVGATVTVTEVYSGATYTLVSAAEQTAVIQTDEIVSVAFENTPTTSRRNGGSITNTFERTEEGGWAWQPIPDENRLQTE